MLVWSLLQLSLQVVQLAGELVGQLKEVYQQGHIIHTLQNQVLKFDPVLVQGFRLGVHIVALLRTQGLQMDLDGFEQQVDQFAFYLRGNQGDFCH